MPTFACAEVQISGKILRVRSASRKPASDIGLIERALVEELLHQGLVRLGDHFDKRLVRAAGRVGEIGRDIFFRYGAVTTRRERAGAHADKIDRPAEGFLHADRQLHRHHLPAERPLKRFERPVEAGPLAGRAG